MAKILNEAEKLGMNFENLSSRQLEQAQCWIYGNDPSVLFWKPQNAEEDYCPMLVGREPGQKPSLPMGGPKTMEQGQAMLVRIETFRKLLDVMDSKGLEWPVAELAPHFPNRFMAVYGEEGIPSSARP